jgi:two-component system nitrate/nitrite response regulator NarL
MVAVAIFSADPILRRSLEQLPRDDPAVTLVGIVDHSSGLPKLLNQNQVDVVLMDIPTGAQLNEWQGFHNNHVVLMVLIDAAEAGDTVEALNAGAQAVLRRSTSPNEIVTAIRAVMCGLVVLQPEILTTWRDETPLADGSVANGSERARLTRRELEVLAAMADGASNKAIARRLGISFHTAKFHVAAILAKLNADSRTEAVTKAAQSGLVML